MSEDKPISLIADFKRRIDYIIMMTGVVPTVIDISASKWRQLTEELKADSRWRQTVSQQPPSWANAPQDDQAEWKHAELFGVRIVREES